MAPTKTGDTVLVRAIKNHFPAYDIGGQRGVLQDGQEYELSATVAGVLEAAGYVVPLSAGAKASGKSAADAAAAAKKADEATARAAKVDDENSKLRTELEEARAALAEESASREAAEESAAAAKAALEAKDGS